MPENESIADAVDLYVSSLEKEEEDGELLENNVKKQKIKNINMKKYQDLPVLQR